MELSCALKKNEDQGGGGQSRSASLEEKGESSEWSQSLSGGPEKA